jgi:hypothetical protein
MEVVTKSGLTVQCFLFIENDSDDDREYYKQEVGMEPDAGMFYIKIGFLIIKKKSEIAK